MGRKREVDPLDNATNLNKEPPLSQRVIYEEGICMWKPLKGDLLLVRVVTFKY